MTSSFVLGYLSAEAEEQRHGIRELHEIDFAIVEELSTEALADLKAIEGDATKAYLVGMAFWVRSLECCQAAIILIERGLPTAPFPILAQPEPRGKAADGARC